MPDITLANIRASLAGAPARYDDYLQTLEWSVGRLKDIPRYLLPKPEGEAGEAALQRLARRAASSGPRAYQHIRDGVIGGVNWGGKDDELDKGLEGINLDALAERLFERAAISGLIVGIVAENEGETTIRRLGGYVEPITDPFDYDLVRGIAQVTRQKSVGGQSSYRVRVYDLDNLTLREWSGVTDPGAIKDDAEAMPLAFPPRYRVLQAGPDGVPVGDMQRVLPLLQSEWASQVRGDRTEEATGFPQAVIYGEVLSGVDKRGPTNIIEMSKDGDFKFVLPGDLKPMHEHHARKLQRIQEELRLPAGSLGTQTPSGEALREAATKFVQMITRYASALEGVIDELVEDYARAIGAKPVAVSVDINREYEKAAKITSTIELWNAGLIPRSAAVREIHPFVKTMTSEELEAFIAGEDNPLGMAPFLPSAATAEEVASEDELKQRADAFAVLVRAGVTPESAARIVGFEGATFTGESPVTLRPRGES